MSTTVELERIESLETQVRQLEAALTAARNIRLMFIAGVLILMGLIIYLFMGLFRKVTSQEFQTAVMNEAQARLEVEQETYMNHVKTVVDGASPVVTKAFYEQTKNDMPKYTAAIDTERETFAEQIKTQLETQLRAHYSEQLAANEARLVAEFPELKDDAFRERVMASLDQALGELASKYYTDQLGAAIGGIYEDWDQFPPVDPPTRSDPPLGDQLIGTLLELLSHRLAQ